MKRNLDLIRHILLKLEETSESRLDFSYFTNEHYSRKQVAYHIALLNDAGLIVTTSISVLGQERPTVIIERLTNSGHDFLDALRDENIFNNTKKTLLSVAGTSTFEIVMSIAMNFLKQKLGI